MSEDVLISRRRFLRISAGMLSAWTLPAVLDFPDRCDWTDEEFVVGVNYPWISYGHDFGKNAWGHDGLITSGWTYQTWPDSQGFTDTRVCTERACQGSGSLCITADLVGQHPNKSRGEVYIDLQNHRPPGVSVPLNLKGAEVSCCVWLPKGSAGENDARNGVQLFFKSEGWDSWYSDWKEIVPASEEQWTRYTARLSDPPAYQNPKFDPTKVRAIGLKVAVNDQSSATLKGQIYLDDYVLNTSPPVTFDFEQHEIVRDFITLEEVFTKYPKYPRRVVRVFVFADGRAGLNFASTGEVVGLDEYVFQDFDLLITAAEQHNLLLMPTVLDYRWCDVPKPENGVQPGNHSDILRDPTKRQTFLDYALKPLVERYRDHSHIFAWNVINEPEWATIELIEDFRISDPVTLQEMREFIRVCTETIHTYTSHPVTFGSARLKWLYPYNYWKELDLDLYQFHWYDHYNAQEPFPWPPYCELGLDKPCIIGEVPTANTRYLIAQFLDVARKRGYYGLLMWSYRASDYYSDFSRVQAQFECFAASNCSAHLPIIRK